MPIPAHTYPTVFTILFFIYLFFIFFFWFALFPTLKFLGLNLIKYPSWHSRIPQFALCLQFDCIWSLNYSIKANHPHLIGLVRVWAWSWVGPKLNYSIRFSRPKNWHNPILRFNWIWSLNRSTRSNQPNHAWFELVWVLAQLRLGLVWAFKNPSCLVWVEWAQKFKSNPSFLMRKRSFFFFLFISINIYLIK